MRLMASAAMGDPRAQRCVQILVRFISQDLTRALSVKSATIRCSFTVISTMVSIRDTKGKND